MARTRKTDLAETTTIKASDIFAAHGMDGPDQGAAFEVDGREFVSLDTMLQVTSMKDEPIGLCVAKLGVNSIFPQQFCMFMDGTTKALHDEVYHVVEVFDPDADASVQEFDEGPF